MGYIPTKMMHNRFVAVRLPKPSEIFGRTGFRQSSPLGYTGDETMLNPGTKIDKLREMDELMKARDQALQKEQNQ